jgi:hypothetical protein
MTRQVIIMTMAGMIHLSLLIANDLEKTGFDLVVPSTTDELPAPGKRVRHVNHEYMGSEVYHLLYLPTDWVKGEKYPVIVEYSGNNWKSSHGLPEGSNLGYGISGGKGVIWISMPFVDVENQRNALTWWGDINTTVEYCKKTVDRICKEYGGDTSNLFIAGFSRGAIACNYIGLYDDQIASLWCGFICHSHYDGVKKWKYARSDRTSAKTRLKRLGNRPQFISHESSVEETKKYLNGVYPSGNFTFQAISFANHTNTWVLREIPERKVLRDWFNLVLGDKRQQGL